MRKYRGMEKLVKRKSVANALKNLLYITGVLAIFDFSFRLLEYFNKVQRAYNFKIT